MALFLLETDSLFSISSIIDSICSNVNDIRSEIESFDLDNGDGFDFNSVKNSILHNLDSYNKKIQNSANLLECVAESHKSLQNSVGCIKSDAISNASSSINANSLTNASSGSLTSDLNSLSDVSTSSSSSSLGTALIGTSVAASTLTSDAIESSNNSSVGNVTNISTESVENSSNDVTNSTTIVDDTANSTTIVDDTANSTTIVDDTANSTTTNDTTSSTVTTTAGITSAKKVSTSSKGGTSSTNYSSKKVESTKSDVSSSKSVNTNNNSDDSKVTSSEKVNNSNYVSSYNSAVDDSYTGDIQLNDVGYAYVDSSLLSDESVQLFKNEGFYFDDGGYKRLGNRYVVACDESVGKVGDVVRFITNDNEVIEVLVGVNTYSEKNKYVINFLLDADNSNIKFNENIDNLVNNCQSIEKCGNYLRQ